MMQAPTPSQRSMQRRSPAADQAPPYSETSRTMSPAMGSQPRGSAVSNRSHGSGSGRRPQGLSNASDQTAPPQLSQIEKSVTHLLVATKQLLETLTQWSRHAATDANVSDVYVRLGYEFNIACRAFQAINVETSDLGNVPEELREILEATLSQEASVESLDRYLPKIRDIIIGLLHGLKRKQQKLRQKQARDGNLADIGQSSLSRLSSTASVNSASTGLTTLLNEGLPPKYHSDTYGGDRLTAQQEPPPRTSSAGARHSPQRRNASGPDDSNLSSASDKSSLSSGTMQAIPVLNPGEDLTRSMSSTFNVEDFPPPPPPPKQQNALAALQRGGELERRASRRYSAYQISKHLGPSPMGVPMLPPAQNSPIPNRGRDVRESMNAVRGRGQLGHSRQAASQRIDTDSASTRNIGQSISESSDSRPIPPAYTSTSREQDDSPMAKTPDEMLRKPPLSLSQNEPPPPVSNMAVSEPPTAESIARADLSPPHERQPILKSTRRSSVTSTPPPDPTADLTLFLQYKSRVKKFVLEGGYPQLTIPRLQLGFIEKFSWNTHNNGVDLPEIYIQDPVSGVRHELEDLADIKDRSVLVLNVEVLDEVKRHFDEGVGVIKSLVNGLQSTLDDQKTVIARVSENQADASKEITRLASIPTPSVRTSSGGTRRLNGMSLPPLIKQDAAAYIAEIQSLKHDLAVVRQTFTEFKDSAEDSLNMIRDKATTVKKAVAVAAAPDSAQDSSNRRTPINEAQKRLNTESDRLVTRVDDLQDLVEDLRKDVVTRGVRPRPQQLQVIAKDIASAVQDVTKLRNYVGQQGPVWNKIWEVELAFVCADQKELKMSEELCADLQDDLEKASETFALVEAATKEQMKEDPDGAVGGSNGLGRLPRLRNVVVETSADPTVAKEGVLDEVRALQPNHEFRLEAIERAERQRKVELESRAQGAFQQELGKFVEEGKLKKAGGVEEVERRRVAKDERIRKEVWERQNGMTQADGQEGDEEEEDDEDENEEEEEEQEEGDGDAVIAEDEDGKDHTTNGSATGAGPEAVRTSIGDIAAGLAHDTDEEGDKA